MLRNPKRISTYSDAIYDVTIDDDYLYIVNQEPSFKKYNLKTAGLEYTVSLTSSAVGIALINEASAVVGYTGSQNKYDFIELSSGHKSTTTSQTYSLRATGQAQQMAGDKVNEVVIATTNTNSLRKINSDQTSSSITVSEMSGYRANVVVAEEASGTFFLGTNNGKIYNIDSSGTVNSTITLPSGISETTPVLYISGISFYDPYLCVVESRGYMYLYNYWSQELLQVVMVPPNDSSTIGIPMCASVSGESLVVSGVNANYLCSVEGIFFRSGVIHREPYFMGDNLGFRGAVRSKNHAACWSYSTSLNQMHILEADDASIGSAQSSASDNNLPTAARIIRIRDDGLGHKCVEIDTTIPDSETDVDLTRSKSYIEFSTINANTKFDIKDLQG